MKEPEVKKMMRVWMEQWGYMPDPNKKLVNQGTGMTVDDLFYCKELLDWKMKYGVWGECPRSFGDSPCPFQEGKSITPFHITLEYKRSKIHSCDIQRAIGQGVLYQTNLKFPTYLVIDREDLEWFYGIYRIIPFGVITYSNPGGEIVMEERAKLNRWASLSTLYSVGTERRGKPYKNEAQEIKYDPKTLTFNIHRQLTSEYYELLKEELK